MVPFVLGAREHHGVDSVARLRARHASAIAVKAKAGMRYRVHVDPTPVVAQVSAGSWVVVCPSCGSGCAVEPSWSTACCFGCGAVFPSVVVPSGAELAALEAVLLERPQVMTRNWEPGESVADLRAENARHGVKKR